MSSFEAAFGQNAQNIASQASQAAGRAGKVVTSTLTRMNEWAVQGWSSIPYKRTIGLGTAVGVGLAVILSDPPPSLNVSAQPPMPDLTSGSGGRNIPQNVHPMPQAVGSPTSPDLTGMGNRAHVSSGYRVNVSARALGGVDANSLSSQIRSAVGGNPRVSVRMSDDRRSLTSQSVADILGNS